jgi:ATP-binding cassette subfamily B protein
LAVLLVSPILGFVAYKFDKVIRPIFSDIREQNAVLNTRTQENIAGIRVVKSFAKEKHEKDLFDKENVKQLEKNITATYTWSHFFPLMDFISSLTPAFLLITGGALVVGGNMSLGTLVASTGYIWMITGPMRMLGFLINLIEQAITSAEKLFYYLDLGPSIKENENAVFPADFTGHVKFENVCLKYGDKEVLSNVSIDLPPGKKLAIMGATGSGKTSIVNLIGRFYDCTSGKVTIDGIDVRNYKLKSLRQQLGYVPQETFLFSDTVKENISFGNPIADMDYIIEASSLAHAHNFITQMPDGYETIVGERGIGLSGGEKQRIAIARALFKKPQILILDDATSSVDMETEFDIQNSLEKTRRGLSTIIIAHRISSVKDADEIIVIDQGKIVERGTHKALIEREGLYFKMYEDQYKDFDYYDFGKADFEVCQETA